MKRCRAGIPAAFNGPLVSAERLCYNRGLVVVATTTDHRPILFVARQEHGDSLSVLTNVLPWLEEATLITSSSSRSLLLSLSLSQFNQIFLKFISRDPI